MDIKDKNLKIKGRVKLQLHDAKTGILTKETDWIDNIIVNVGLNSIANRLSGANIKALAGEISYCAVGIGASAPAATDTTLDTELDRVAISTASNNVDNVAEIRAFFNKNEANGTLTELGLFGEDATNAADSGTMFQRIAFSFTKTSSETLTIVSQITMSYS